MNPDFSLIVSDGEHASLPSYVRVQVFGVAQPEDKIPPEVATNAAPATLDDSKVQSVSYWWLLLLAPIVVIVAWGASRVARKKA